MGSVRTWGLGTKLLDAAGTPQQQTIVWTHGEGHSDGYSTRVERVDVREAWPDWDRGEA